MVAADGHRGNEPMTAPTMKDFPTTPTFGQRAYRTISPYIRFGGWEARLSQSLAGTPVDEIMKIGGWKTRKMATHYIGQTCGGGQDAAAGQDVEIAYQTADAAPTGAGFQDM